MNGFWSKGSGVLKLEGPYGPPIYGLGVGGCPPIDVGKNSLVNEGELPSDKSQLDSLSFGIVSSIGVSGPVADYNGCLHLHRGLWISFQNKS